MAGRNSLVAQKRNPFRARNVAVKGNTTLTIGAEAANAIAVTIQLKDDKVANLTETKGLMVWLSDHATDGTIISSAPDGGVAIGSSTGKIVTSLVANKHFYIMTSATGSAILAITHAAGAKTLYVYVQLPDGSIKISGAVTFA